MFIKHGYGCQVVSWMESWFGMVQLWHRTLQVRPGVHDVVRVKVKVEVLTLKDQSQSPTERNKELRVID